MKVTLLIAAALLGTAAVAQTTPSMPNTPAGTDDANTMPATGVPSTDASAAPAMSSNAQAVTSDATGTTDTSNYPVCSRTVRDKCVQRGAMHKARRHH